MNKITTLLLLSLFFSMHIAGISQHVGINNPLPATALDVIGTTTIERASSSTNPQLNLRDIGDGYSRLRFSRPDAISDNYWLLSGRTFEGGDGSSRFNLYYKGDSVVTDVVTVTGLGNMGLSVVPSDRLHIAAPADGNALRVQIGGATKLRVFGNGGTAIGSNNLSTPPNGLYVSGNTGLGVNDPDDKLEVNGNVDITGGIKANGVAGTKAQMLAATSNGDLTWVSPCEFNRYLSRWQASTSPWVVPSGVTEVQFELWGAGGGGSAGGGGGAGGYVKAIVAVTEGQLYNITVGNGGAGVANGMNQSGGAGGTSQVTGNGLSLSATGGSGATMLAPGNGGAFSTGTLLSHILRRGEPGQPNFTQPIYADYSKTEYGNGGQPAFTYDTFGKGEITSGSGGGIIRNDGTSGLQPGGGGGGGNFSNNGGGDGYVIIRWNE